MRRFVEKWAVATSSGPSPRRFERRIGATVFGRLWIVASIVCGAHAADAQTTLDQPYYANGKIHCPDGSSGAYHSQTGEGPNDDVLRFACEFNAQHPAQEPAPTPGAAQEPAAEPDASATSAPAGVIRCPDGTTRPGFVRSDEMSGVAEAMACSKPAASSAAMERKNREIAIRDAREGRVGLWTALKTAWETGDVLLIAYLAGKLSFYAAIIGLVVFLLTRRRGGGPVNSGSRSSTILEPHPDDVSGRRSTTDESQASDDQHQP
ncbi:hypothetical protein [Dongia sp.]|uniref:hypothetical protein n=1 Tax=Dongia sp. TaxID=1977262 RepID=UPI0035B3EC3D